MTDAVKLAKEMLALVERLPSNKFTDGSPLAILAREVVRTESQSAELETLRAERDRLQDELSKRQGIPHLVARVRERATLDLDPEELRKLVEQTRGQTP